MAKKKTTAPPQFEIEIAEPGRLIPSGVTLLDLACTDSIDGFCEAKHAVNIIGDRNVGKTALAVASQAETFSRYGDEYVYDFLDGENAYSFQTARLWGTNFAKALNVIPIPPDREWAIEALAHWIVDRVSDGRPHHIVLDSMDSLRPTSSWDNVEDIVAGNSGYNTARAKANRYFFNIVIPALARSRSFLIYLSQATCNMGFGAQFNPKVRGGGTALGYNAFVELWLSAGPSIKSADTKVGHWVVAKVARSKANGKCRTIRFPILPAYGIDDTRANVEWLVEEGVIKRVTKPGEKVEDNGRTYAISAEDAEKRKPKNYDLRPLGIDYIGDAPLLFVENNDHVAAVRDAVRQRWDENEQTHVTRTFGGRKTRYG